MATAVLLAAPATADAIQGKHGDYPLPTTVCGPATAPGCWTMEPDTYTFDAAVTDRGQTFDGKDIEIVSASFKRWAFPEEIIPLALKQDIIPVRAAQWSETRIDGAVVATGAGVGPDMSYIGVEAYCNLYREIKHRSVRVGIDSTPDAVMEACKFLRRTSDPLTDEEKPQIAPPASTTGVFSDQPVGQVASVPIPRRSASCGKVRGRGKTVVVRATNSSCKGSRLIVARYARTGKQPRGWRCFASKKQARVRCARTVRSRAKVRRMVVYGITVRR